MSEAPPHNRATHHANTIPDDTWWSIVDRNAVEYSKLSQDERTRRWRMMRWTEVSCSWVWN